MNNLLENQINRDNEPSSNNDISHTQQPSTSKRKQVNGDNDIAKRLRSSNKRYPEARQGSAVKRQKQDDSLKFDKNQVISFHLNDGGNRREAVVMGRAGKVTTDKRNWFNIKYLKPEILKGKQISIDLSKTHELRV